MPPVNYTFDTGSTGDPAAAPPADTRRVYPDRAPCDAPPGYCACTFYLVFKEPDACPDAAPKARSRAPPPRPFPWGEPYNTTESASPLSTPFPLPPVLHTLRCRTIVPTMSDPDGRSTGSGGDSGDPERSSGKKICSIGPGANLPAASAGSRSVSTTIRSAGGPVNPSTRRFAPRSGQAPDRPRSSL